MDLGLDQANTSIGIRAQGVSVKLTGQKTWSTWELVFYTLCRAKGYAGIASDSETIPPRLPEVHDAVPADAPPGTVGRLLNEEEIEAKEALRRTFEVKQVQLLFCLHQTLDVYHLEEIRDLSDPFEALKRLDQKYIKWTTTEKRIALGALMSFEMSDTDSAATLQRRSL